MDIYKYFTNAEIIRTDDTHPIFLKKGAMKLLKVKKEAPLKYNGDLKEITGFEYNMLEKIFKRS